MPRYRDDRGHRNTQVGSYAKQKALGEDGAGEWGEKHLGLGTQLFRAGHCPNHRPNHWACISSFTPWAVTTPIIPIFQGSRLRYRKVNDLPKVSQA